MHWFLFLKQQCMTKLHLTVLKRVGYKVALEGNFGANRIRIPILRDSEIFYHSNQSRV